MPLRVVEIGRDGDDGLGDLLAEIGLGGFLQLGEDHGGDLGRGVFLALDFDAGIAVFAPHHLVRDHLLLFAHFIGAPAHKPLDRENRILGVCDGLAFRHLPNEPLAGFGERDDRRGGATALLVRDNRGLTALHDGDDGVRRAQIDTNNFAHVLFRNLLGKLPPCAGILLRGISSL